VRRILVSVDAVVEDRLDLLFALMEGKDITRLIAAGREQLADAASPSLPWPSCTAPPSAYLLGQRDAAIRGGRPRCALVGVAVPAVFFLMIDEGMKICDPDAIFFLEVPPSASQVIDSSLILLLEPGISRSERPRWHDDHGCCCCNLAGADVYY